MRMRSKRITAVLLAAATALSLAACSNTGTTASDAGTSAATEAAATAADDGRFHIAIPQDPSSLDPTQCNDYSAEIVANNLYDTLLRFSDEGNELEPCIAESWEKVDELTYVYTIRQGVKFWDGNEVTAEDVAFSLSRHMDPDNASLFGYMYYAVDSIEATGDYEVTITLSAPATSFMYVPATMAGAVYEKAYYEEHADQYGTPAGSVMATGPYKFDSWIEGSQIVFTRNEDYWKADTEYPSDTLEFDIIADDAATALALASGQVQFQNDPDYDTYDQVNASGVAEIVSSEGLQNQYVMFNCSTGPFADVNVRKAAATAIDAAAIGLATKGEGYYTDAGAQDVDPAVLGYYTEDWVALQEELDPYTYDVEKAKEYLAQSGYPDGFECTMPVCPSQQKVSEAIQYYLGQIGITVNLESMTFNEMCLYVYGTKLNDEGLRDYDLLAFEWFPDYADPYALLNLYYGENAGVGGSNQAAYMNDEFDALLDLSETQDGEERSETLMDAYRMLNADCPMKMFTYFGPLYAISTDYEATMSPMWMWNFNFTKVRAK